jgi:fibronectin type 3 domain-containing protein
MSKHSVKYFVTLLAVGAAVTLGAVAPATGESNTAQIAAGRVTGAGNAAADSALSPVAQTAATGDPVVAVGGDIACPPGRTPSSVHCQQNATGAVVTGMNPNYVIPVGDTQYDTGSPSEYAGSYNVTGWGTEKTISFPAAGNHEYRTTGATGYYGYFGSNAGDPNKGYYSWNLPIPGGTHWHLIALNSECSVLGGGSISAGCGAGSTQEKWLKADLAANPNVCTIAYWHRPRFSSSSTTPSSTTYNAFWNDLYSAGADLILNGHAHDYERFGPQTSAGVSDPKGPVEFVVGTGGEDFQGAGPLVANSKIFNNTTFGALKLTLHANSYDYQFIPAAGYSLSDSGSGTCHAAPATDTTKPTAPGTPTATASSASQVNLNWSAATDNVGVKNYIIYRGSNGATPTQIATTTTNSTSYTDTTVVANTSYTYQVAAQDAAGNIGPLSGIASVTTPASTDTTPPTTPTNLAAESVFYNEIDLGWTGSTDSGTGVSGYRIYRKGPGESTFTLLATTTGTGAGHNSYPDTSVKPSSSYTYQVSAVDGANNESGKASVTASTPSGPSSQTYTFTATDDATIQQANATATGNTSPLIVDNSPVDDALLRFNVSTSGCDTLTSAKLTLTDNSDGSVQGGDFYTTGANWSEGSVTWNTAPTRGTLLNSLGAVASNATVSVDVTQGATLNGAVAFRVGTTSSDGVHYFSKEGTGGKPTLTVICTSATVPDTQAPTAPSNLKASAIPGEIDLSWTASTDNLAVTNYDIYRGSTLIGTVPSSSLTYQDTTVTAGTSYSYTVKARDAAGNVSSPSNTATATATSTRPSAPTGLSATATSSTSVHLTWNANTTDSLQGYNVYRALHSGGTPSLVGSVGAGTTAFDDTTAAAGTSYDYTVTSVATGGAESLPSNTATVTTPGSGGGGGGGGTITAGAKATTQVTTAATSWTVNLPSFNAGDLVVIWVANNLGSTAGTPSATGWTTQVSTNESSGLKGAFLTRQMASGDPSTVTVTFTTATSGLAAATAFSGVSATTPVDAKGGAAEASTTAVTTHTTPSVTATANEVLVSGFTTDKAATWTSSDTELADVTSGSVSGALYYSAPVAAGSYTRSATATVGSVKAVSSVLVLRPA